jgi:hypothetical protein
MMLPAPRCLPRRSSRIRRLVVTTSTIATNPTARRLLGAAVAFAAVLGAIWSVGAAAIPDDPEVAAEVIRHATILLLIPAATLYLLVGRIGASGEQQVNDVDRSFLKVLAGLFVAIRAFPVVLARLENLEHVPQSQGAAAAALCLALGWCVTHVVHAAYPTLAKLSGGQS